MLQISANRPGAGKTSLAGALLLHLISEGRRVAYYKPFSPAGEADLDAQLLSERLTTDVGSSPLPTIPAAGAAPVDGTIPADVKKVICHSLHTLVDPLRARGCGARSSRYCRDP